jgi:hypothetical protein
VKILLSQETKIFVIQFDLLILEISLTSEYSSVALRQLAKAVAGKVKN